MSPALALLLCIVFIVYLFITDSRECGLTSWTLWIPLLWLIIGGSRSVALWLNAGPIPVTETDIISGSPVDRAVLTVLIIIAIVILLTRNLSEFQGSKTTRWVFLFLAYCGVSIFWSDFQFVAFKRWIKEIGNLLMVLIILSDPRPREAVRTVVRRVGYLLIPLSIVLIKYYLDYGRSYNPWSGEVEFIGVATSKNMLGNLCFLCGIFFFWSLVTESRKKQKIIDALFLSMIVWLLIKANSATSWVSFGLGCFIVCGMGFSAVKGNPRSIGGFIFLSVVSFLILQLGFDVGELLVSSLGRDMTLTGRTELWSEVLDMVTNPIIGTGYDSFWLGDRITKLWSNHWWRPIQAHNGYLETYLNLGWIGVMLLGGVVFSSYKSIRDALLLDFDQTRLYMALVIAALINNTTEATFKGVSIVWSVFLLVSLDASLISRLETRLDTQDSSDCVGKRRA